MTQTSPDTPETPNPFARDFEDQSLRSLYRKMKKTALARFECAAASNVLALDDLVVFGRPYHFPSRTVLRHPNSRKRAMV